MKMYESKEDPSRKNLILSKIRKINDLYNDLYHYMDDGIELRGMPERDIDELLSSFKSIRSKFKGKP